MFIYSDATRLVRGHNIVPLGSGKLRGVRGVDVADLPPALLVVHCVKRHPFLRRRQVLDPITFPSEGLEKALKRMLGSPIFQEQVMQVAMLAAGFSVGEADQLRRAMATWKRKGGLEQYHETLVSGMLERGYDREFAESIFAQIKGFGEYGFPESHAASFALLVYSSAWLRRHEPAEFPTGSVLRGHQQKDGLRRAYTKDISHMRCVVT